MKRPHAFKEPILVTRPVLPPLEDVQSRLAEVWESRWLTNGGPQLKALQDRLTAFLDVPYINLFSNGTLALEICLKAFGIEGEVITTPFTFPATTLAISSVGATPVFVDVEPRWFNIDVDAIEAAITPKTTAIVPVHVFGNPCDVYRIELLAKKYGLKVIYDAAHAFGVSLDSMSIGQFGDASMFSFHATKMFHTAEGGAITTKHGHLCEAFDLWKNFGLVDGKKVVVPGTNAKMNEIQAIIGLATLPLVENETKVRAQHISLYKELLSQIPGISTITPAENVVHNNYNMPILVDPQSFGLSSFALQQELAKFNIFTRKYFYPLCDRFEFYARGFSCVLPVAERVASQVLCLPLYGTLTSADIEQIVTAIGWIGESAKESQFAAYGSIEEPH